MALSVALLGWGALLWSVKGRLVELRQKARLVELRQKTRLVELRRRLGLWSVETRLLELRRRLCPEQKPQALLRSVELQQKNWTVVWPYL